MKLFMKRIYQATVNVLLWVVVFILTLAVSLIVTAIVGGLVVLLPVYVLSLVIEQYSIIWIALLFVFILLFNNWDSIKSWVNWQFIEPFKKGK